MGRSFFPTYSLNRFGVRDTNQRGTLGAAFDSEPNIRAANNPTGPMLGAVGLIGPQFIGDGSGSKMIRVPSLPALPSGGPVYWTGPVSVGPIVRPPLQYTPPISSSGGGGAVQPQNPITPPNQPVVPPGPVQLVTSGTGDLFVPPPPVSVQTSPTPTVTVPPPAPSSVLVVSSGGGTQTPSTPTVVAAPSTTTGLVDGIAAWLGGTTSVFNYNVPNALIAGVGVLGFAWLSSNSGKKR